MCLIALEHNKFRMLSRLSGWQNTQYKLCRELCIECFSGKHGNQVFCRTATQMCNVNVRVFVCVRRHNKCVYKHCCYCSYTSSLNFTYPHRIVAFVSVTANWPSLSCLLAIQLPRSEGENRKMMRAREGEEEQTAR